MKDFDEILGFEREGHNSARNQTTRLKDCHCHTCGRDYHHLGIMRHRSMHRDRREDCEITFSTGVTYRYRYASPNDTEASG